MPDELMSGDPAPWFSQKCTTPYGGYSFDMAAGRVCLLFFFSSSSIPEVARFLEVIRENVNFFDGADRLFFGVSADPSDVERLSFHPPGIRFFFDGDGSVARAWGVGTGPCLILTDRFLRVEAVEKRIPTSVDRVLEEMDRLVRMPDRAAPALVLDRVFEPAFCQELVRYYGMQQTVQSAIYTADESGQSQAVMSVGYKRRRDCQVRDAGLVRQIQARLIRRVVPEIHKVFQFTVSELDRLLLSCYDAEDRGCFGPHRDNTIGATAHRRFAVSITLNRGFSGGGLVFPEFGRQAIEVDAGSAVIFSCSLLHAVQPVTLGRRYACLPFVYDRAAAAVKKEYRAQAAHRSVTT